MRKKLYWRLGLPVLIFPFQNHLKMGLMQQKNPACCQTSSTLPTQIKCATKNIILLQNSFIHLLAADFIVKEFYFLNYHLTGVNLPGYIGTGDSDLIAVNAMTG